MSQAFSGTYANVVAGTMDMDAEGWTLDLETNSFNSTTTADDGWEDETGSTSKASGSFDFFYNVAKKPTGAAAGLKQGSVVELTLYPNKNAYPSETFSGSALIKKLSIKSKVNEGFMVTANWTSKGPWTLPS